MSADILLKIVVVVYVASTLAACSATMCFETPDCSGQLYTVKPSPKQCCVETDGVAFYMDTEGNCKRCIETTIGVEHQSLTVSEEDSCGQVEVCVIVFTPQLDCPIIFSFNINFYTKPITATSGSDYTALAKQTLRFGCCETRQCVNVQILNDQILEDTESFNVSLEDACEISSRFRFDPQEVSVFITDVDKITLGFERSVYTTSETRAVSVCASVTVPSSGCASASPFTVNLLFSSGTADFSDYGSTSANCLEFSACSRRSCATIRMENDLQLEEDEFFSLVLQSPNPRHILNPSIVTIEINNDADVAVVDLERVSYQVTEGGSVVVYAFVRTPNISCPIDFAFELSLSVGNDDQSMTFNRCAKRSCVGVSFDDDDEVENTESVSITLRETVGLNNRISIGKSSGVIEVADDGDTVLVGLDKTFYQFSEDSQTNLVCVEVFGSGCPIRFPITVNLTTSDITANNRSDYNPLREKVVTLGACATKACVDIDIINDRTAEKLESFTVTLGRTPSLDSRISLINVEAHIMITDDDEAVVGLQRSIYQVREGVGVVQVCILVHSPSIGCPVAYPFTVVFSTVGDSAGAGTDYVHFNNVVQFKECQRSYCHNVAIVDDLVLEAAESFNVSIVRNGLDNSISLNPTTAKIEITDDDVAVVGLQQTEYQVDEGAETITVCGEVKTTSVDCIIHSPFGITFTTSDRTARDTEDYDAVSSTLVLAACETVLCQDITIINDLEVENMKSFRVTLGRTPDLDSRISINPTRADVIVNDDDAATVHIEETAYKVAENQSSVEVCAVIQSPHPTNCPVNFGISVRFTTANGDAVAGEDYTRRTTTLSFGSCGRRSCTTVAITNDWTVEPSVEMFTVSLAAVNDDTRIRVRTLNSTVSICDDDDSVVRLDRSLYQGTESVGTINVCARVESPSVSCPIRMPFSVHISTIDDIAESSDTKKDFTSLASATLSFEKCERLVCVSITIMNDLMVEMAESFNVTLTRTASLDRRIKLNPLKVDGVVRITDNDAATVAMEQATVTVMEGDNCPVFVCANVTTPDISCPVDFDFDITFSVNAESTDYDGLPATVKFPACALGTCVNVTIADDAVVENTESFRISLTRTTGLDSRITLTGTTELQISDDDSAVVAMKQSYDFVGENDGSKQLCAVVENEGSVAFSFNINLLFDSPLDSADNGDDFVPPSRRYLTFEPMYPESCVTIAIRNSVDLEMPESFFVSLQKPSGLDDRISINTDKDETEVEILDDDKTQAKSEALGDVAEWFVHFMCTAATVGFQNTVYTLSSGQSSVRVCVYVHRPTGINCPIQFPFDMRFQLVGDTNDVFEVELNSDIVVDGDDSSYLNLLFDTCQRNFCFSVDLKDGVSRPARGERFPIEVSRTPDHGRTTLLDPVDGEIVIS